MNMIQRIEFFLTWLERIEPFRKRLLWNRLLTSLPWFSFSTFLSRAWWTNWWKSSRRFTVIPRISQCARPLSTSSRRELFFSSRRWRSSWWKCMSSSPPSTTGSVGRRPTRPQAIPGWVGWCQIPSMGATASPGRKTNTGQGSRRRHWYHAAAASSTPSFTSSSSAAWPAGVGQHLCLRLLARRTG